MRTTTLTPPAVLAGTDLHKRYGDTPALAGVDLQVSGGQSVAVTGPSGSGKSTLLYCLAGVLQPDAGSVTLGGERVDRLSDRARSELRRRRYGFVFQFGGLLPELTAAENVALPLMLAGRRRAAAVAAARPLLDALGLGGLAGRRPGQLSGGQAQRVAIARALVIEPDVVFADEPTGALDSVTGAEVMGLLIASVRQRGAALVVVTHDASVAAACDRSVELRDGHLAAGAAPVWPAGPAAPAFVAGPAYPATAPHGWPVR
jgi:putative ABC transport system ATP-binding protein